MYCNVKYEFKKEWKQWSILVLYKVEHFTIYPAINLVRKKEEMMELWSTAVIAFSDPRKKYVPLWM